MKGIDGFEGGFQGVNGFEGADQEVDYLFELLAPFFLFCKLFGTRRPFFQ